MSTVTRENKWLSENGFIVNYGHATILWVDDDVRVHEIIIEFCIGEYCVGYYIDRGLRDGKVRCGDFESAKKTIQEFKQLYFPKQ